MYLPASGHYTGIGVPRPATCAAGKFSSGDRLACGVCPGGTYVNRTLSDCVLCSVGRYAPAVVNDNCIVCGAGFATGGVLVGATSCSSCAPGTYSGGLKPACGVCPSGKQSGTRAAQCDPCEAGTFAAANNSASCQACDAVSASQSENS